MIPNVISSMIGLASLTHGIPGVPPYFSVATFVLILQLVGGGILGIVAQLSLLCIIFGYLMPRIGLELLDMARAVAIFDVPSKLLSSL
jgi:hypothetical protein